MVFHEVGQAPGIGGEVAFPVVGLGHGEVEDVVGVFGQRPQVTSDEIDRDALDAGGLELGARRHVAESRCTDHSVVPGQGNG